MASDDVLTEGEIDALMESVDDGTSAADAADDGQFRRFDFAAREQSLLREFTAPPCVALARIRSMRSASAVVASSSTTDEPSSRSNAAASRAPAISMISEPAGASARSAGGQRRTSVP